MRNFLLLTLSLIGCTPVANQANCKAVLTLCQATEYCDDLTETCLPTQFTVPPTPSAILPTVPNAEQLIIVAMNAGGPKDLVLKNQDSVTICYGIGTAAVHCTAAVTLDLMPSSFIRIVDVNRNKKQSILVVPRLSLNPMGKILLHDNSASDTLTLQNYRLPVTGINDALPVERATPPGTDLWIATEQNVIAPMFVSTGISMNGDTLLGPGMLSLQLTRPSADPPGLQLLGVRTNEVSVIAQSGNIKMITTLNTMPSGISKLRTGYLNSDSALDVVAATDAPFKFYSALAQSGSVFPSIVPIDFFTTTTNSFEIADIDGKGMPGVVVLSDKRTFSYLAGKGDGTFANPEVRVRSDQDVAAFAVQDINGDAKADLVYTTVAGEIRVLLSAAK